MASFNEVAVHDTVQEDDDVHHGAANIHMGEVKEFAVNRFYMFISRRNFNNFVWEMNPLLEHYC